MRRSRRQPQIFRCAQDKGIGKSFEWEDYRRSGQGAEGIPQGLACVDENSHIGEWAEETKVGSETKAAVRVAARHGEMASWRFHPVLTQILRFSVIRFDGPP